MMSLLMSMQIRFLVKSLVAARVRATEWFLTSVNPEMRFQVEIQAELFTAYFTFVRFLTSMNKHMSFKFRVVQKTFVAVVKGALKLNFSREKSYQLVTVDCHVLF